MLYKQGVLLCQCMYYQTVFLSVLSCFGLSSMPSITVWVQSLFCCQCLILSNDIVSFCKTAAINYLNILPVMIQVVFAWSRRNTEYKKNKKHYPHTSWQCKRRNNIGFLNNADIYNLCLQRCKGHGSGSQKIEADKEPMSSWHFLR